MSVLQKLQTRPAFTFLAFLLFMCFEARAQADSSAEDHFDIIITDIDLIDGTGKPLQPAVNLYIKDGTFVEIHKKKKANATAKTLIDGTGKYAIPGLFDAHYHFINYKKRNIEDFKEQGRYLTHFGITSILVTNGIIEDLKRFSELVNSGSATGPRVFYTSRMVTLPGAHPAKGEEKDSFIDGLNIDYVHRIGDIEKIVLQAKQEGAVAVKIVVEDGPTPPMVERMPEAFIREFTKEAHKRELPVFVHVSDMEEVRMSVKNNVDALVHGALVDLPEDEEILEAMAQKNISWVFTNMLPKSMIFYPLNLQWLEEESYEVFDSKYILPLKDPDDSKVEMSHQILSHHFNYDSPPTFDSFVKQVMKFNRTIFEKGVNIVVGTDTGGPSPYILPGISVHEEMEMLQLSGLDPLQIIKMSSLNAARMIGKEDSLGSVEKGKTADLVLLNQNPLENITNSLRISKVIKDGKVLERIKKK